MKKQFLLNWIQRIEHYPSRLIQRLQCISPMDHQSQKHEPWMHQDQHSEVEMMDPWHKHATHKALAWVMGLAELVWSVVCN